MRIPDPKRDLPSVFIPSADMFFDRSDWDAYSSPYEHILSTSESPILALQLEIPVQVLTASGDIAIDTHDIGDFLVQCTESKLFNIIPKKSFKRLYRKRGSRNNKGRQK